MGYLRDLFGSGPIGMAAAVKASAPERKTASLSDPATRAYFLGSGVDSERVGEDFRSLVRNAFARQAAAYRAIMDIASGAATTPVNVFIRGEKASDHPIAELLAVPNPREDGCELLEQFFAYRMLDGNSYLRVIDTSPDDMGGGKPIALEVLHPMHTKVERIFVGNMPALKYTYRPGAPFQDLTWVVTYDDVASPIVHWKAFNPRGGCHGLSPLISGRSGIDRVNLSAEWNASLMRNGAKPSGAFFVKDGEDGRTTLTDDERAVVEAELEKFTGAKNVGRPMIVEGGLSFESMQLTPVEVDWTAGAAAAAREVCNAIGYPAMLLAIPGDNTHQNQREARLALWETTIIPHMKSAYKKLARDLAPRYGLKPTELELRPDLNDVDALAVRRERVFERVGKADWISVNEARRETGFDARPEIEADQIRVSYAKIPLGETSVVVQPQPAAAGDPSKGDNAG